MRYFVSNQIFYLIFNLNIIKLDSFSDSIIS